MPLQKAVSLPIKEGNLVVFLLGCSWKRPHDLFAG